MARDRVGEHLAIGDIVYIPARVVEVQEPTEERPENIAIETIHPTTAGGTPSRMRISSAQVHREGYDKPQSSRAAVREANVREAKDGDAKAAEAQPGEGEPEERTKPAGPKEVVDVMGAPGESASDGVNPPSKAANALLDDEHLDSTTNVPDPDMTEEEVYRILDMSVPDIKEALADQSDPRHLKQLKAAEKANRNRSSVMDLLNKKLEAAKDKDK